MCSEERRAKTAPPGDSTRADQDRFRLIPLISLATQPGLGPKLLSTLIGGFGDAESAINAPTQELLALSGVGERTVAQIRRAKCLEHAQQVLRWCESHQVQVIPSTAKSYPQGLHHLADKPALLYVQGNICPEDALAVAVVGTRHATPYGVTQANRFGYGLAKAGMTIVSGLARGIDATAHRAALDGGGRTIAVLGSGHGRIYPDEHAGLAQDIARSGAVISEYPPFCPPRSGQFPQRNRLIAALALGTLVVEAPERSGALITARMAGELNRDVFAIPGPVQSRASHGCHQLIRDGVTLVQSMEQLVDELGPMSEPIQTSNGRFVRHSIELNLNPVESEILDAITPHGTLIDEVINATSYSTPQVIAAISVLEMRKLVRRLSGQCVARI